MSIKGKGMLLALMAMSCMFANPQSGGYYNDLTAEDVKDLERRREESRLRNLRKQGVQEWEIDGFIVYARDRKNAERKVANAKKLLNQNS
jgi:hypothetical protein